MNKETLKTIGFVLLFQILILITFQKDIMEFVNFKFNPPNLQQNIQIEENIPKQQNEKLFEYTTYISSNSKLLDEIVNDNSKIFTVKKTFSGKNPNIEITYNGFEPCHLYWNVISKDKFQFFYFEPDQTIIFSLKEMMPDTPCILLKKESKDYVLIELSNITLP